MGRVRTDDRTIGQNLKRYRNAAGLSQSQLALQLLQAGFEGIHPQTVLKIERGERPLRLTEARIVAEVFDIPLNYLYETSEEAEDELDGLRRERAISLGVHNLRKAVTDLQAAQDAGEEWLEAHPRSKTIAAYGIRQVLDRSDILEIVNKHVDHHRREKEENRAKTQRPVPAWANDPDPEEEQEETDGLDQEAP